MMLLYYKFGMGYGLAFWIADQVGRDRAGRLMMDYAMLVYS